MLGTVIPFLRGHAAPPCALKGTCACSAPLHEGGGGGSLGPFTALRSRPSARMTPSPPYRAHVVAVLSLPVCAPLPGSSGCCCVPPLCTGAGGEYVYVGVLGAPWHSSAVLLGG